MLGSNEVNKFDFIYSGKDNKPIVGATKNRGDDSSSEEDEEEDENLEELHKRLGIEPDDIHAAAKVILQRQFFEAIVRAASVKYANSSEFTSLAQKLDYLFNKHLSPMVGKNKAKSPDEEVSLSNSNMRKCLMLFFILRHRNNSKCVSLSLMNLKNSYAPSLSTSLKGSMPLTVFVRTSR